MSKLFSRRYLLFALVVAAAGGFLRVFWLFGAMPSQPQLISAARGVAAHDGISHYAASIGDAINGWLWRTGGASWLQGGLIVSEFLGAAIVGILVLLGIGMLGKLLKNNWLRCFLIGGAVILLLGYAFLPFWRGWTFRAERVGNLKLIAPVELDSKLVKHAYTNADAAALLPLFGKTAAGGVSREEFGLVGSPKAWREALRKSSWQQVLLTGPPTNYQPLLEHLITSPDWTLSILDNQGYLFSRGSGTPLPAFDAKTFRLANDLETAIYLAQISVYFDAIHRSREARECIEQALILAPKNALVLSYAATFAATHKRWQDALTYAGKALARDPEFLQAKVVEAMALLELGQPNRAQAAVEQVLAKAPDDFYTLFIHARICRAANDFTGEAATLEKIVALCQKNGLPAGNYQLYLGQAYARLGMAKPALLNYRAALQSGLLEKNQLAEVNDAIKTIESRDKP